MLRLFGGILVCGLLGAGAAAHVAAGAPEAPQLGASLDRLLAAYVDGDFEAVSKAFPKSQEFHDARVVDGRRFDRWLGNWQRPKAAFVLELADTSTRVAPQFTRTLLESGRKYITTAEDGRHLGPADQPFVQTWHRAAIGLLQRGAHFEIAEAYVDALGRRARSTTSSPAGDPRLLLGRAIAIEQRCWLTRPMLDRPETDLLGLMSAARMSVNDPHGPPRSLRDAHAVAHQKCLADAAAQFAMAIDASDTRAEARVRAGWVQFQLGRFDQALALLEDVDGDGDPVVAYWAALFRGRVLDGQRRYEAAATAYRQALDICPAAQSAVLGLSLALFRSDRIPEADDLARAYRAGGGRAYDPWWIYQAGDERFVAQWVTELRGLIR
jgi:tetratricopeptide (TPR) repeat protein